ncbi:Proline-rich receptor-like protein [Drosera capensis]
MAGGQVSDFGLAKIFSSQDTSITHITTRVVGTFGYLAPEYASSGKVTDKSDVYSYGIVLLELITGRPPISRPPISAAESTADGSLVNWARPLLAQAIENGTLDGLVDPRLHNHYNLEEMRSMVHCAAACVRLSAWRRPRLSQWKKPERRPDTGFSASDFNLALLSTIQVVRALEGDLSLLDLSSDGIRPNLGPSRFPYETSDSETYQHSEGMKLLRSALTTDGYVADGSRYSGTTSEYGLYPSVSSIDSQHAMS